MDPCSDLPDNACMDNHNESLSSGVGTDQQSVPPVNDRPPLRRVRGVLGGVSAGIADHFNIEPWIIRFAFIATTFAGGFGIVAYLAGWLLIPELGTDESIGERWIKNVASGPAWLGVALVVVGVLILAAGFNIDTGFIWALLFLVLGVLIYRGDLGSRREPRAEGASAEPTSRAFPAAATDAPRHQVERGPRAPRPPRPPKPRSNLGRFTFAALLVGLGGMALFDNAGVIHPLAQHYFALGLAIVGAGLIVGTVWGRSRGLIALGLILAFSMGIATVDHVATRSAPDFLYAPQSVEDIAGTYDIGAGDVIIDLSAVPVADFSFDAHLGAGQLRIILPDGLDATVQSHVGMGSIQIAGQHSEGLGINKTTHIDGTVGTAHIDLNVGAGRIVVTQEGS
jgi:phage shock protein PspC (stress-responsive transcriptional regulator)